MGEGLRIDKWLWAARVYKTRNMATEACKAGKVRMDGMAVKASRVLKEGDVIELSLNPLRKTVRVVQLIHNRVPAKLVPEVLTDLTPPQEYERVQLICEMRTEIRDRGAGRPTKKDRRDLGKLKDIN